jgi:hypothetical protein
MGTRGAFGVIIGEKEKIGYNQFDSYPSGKGLENLNWLRGIVPQGDMDERYTQLPKFRELALDCDLVDDSIKPTPKDIHALRGWTDMGVSNQSTDDWYCLTHATHGSIEMMLRCGYIEDHSEFPLDSLFCEWAYIVDFDRNVFEVYQGFQANRPKRGRWKGRPTAAENKVNFEAHLKWCEENGREPFRPKVPDYKAIEMIASYPFNALPTDDDFLALERVEEEVVA